MNVLLINPSSKEIYGKLGAPVQISLGLAYIAAIIEKNGYNVKILDIEAQKLSLDDISGTITEFRPHVVGLTCTTPVYPSAVEICGIVKKIDSRIKTVLGGIHPTVMPSESVSHESVDYVVFGEGEATIAELLKALDKDSDISGIPGLAFKKNGVVSVNKSRELIEDIDSIPFPARHLFKNQNYTYPDSLSKRTFPIITSRGCPGSCTFCNTQNIFGNKFRARSARNVADEIEMLKDKFRAQEIHIWDDNFTTHKERVFEINNELKKRNIKLKFAFPNGVRADFLSQDVLEALREMGVYSIAIGVESGVQEILDGVNKRIKLDKIISTFKLMKKLKFETWAFFLFGLPGETKSTAEETIKFAMKLNPDIAKFHVLKPFPGTGVFQYLKERNLIICDDLKRYGIHTAPVHKLETLDAKDMEKLQKHAYRQYYFRLSKIIQQLLRMKSWNRIKLNVSAAINLIKTNMPVES